MPVTEVVIYREEDGATPLLDWLAGLNAPKQVAKCLATVEQLKSRGHELRRPTADLLADGIYELRSRVGTVQLRILYFFDKKQAVITHGFVKTGKAVPPEEIDRAKQARQRYLADRPRHTHAEE
jgi:hypothetical protein